MSERCTMTLYTEALLHMKFSIKKKKASLWKIKLLAVGWVGMLV